MKKVAFSNVQKATLKKLNILNMDNDANSLGDEITLNSNKKNINRYLRKIIFL